MWTIFGEGVIHSSLEEEYLLARVVLFLDDETESKMRAAAKAAGVSESQWVAEAIRKTAGSSRQAASR
jgi:hypothetical protein